MKFLTKKFKREIGLLAAIFITLMTSCQKGKDLESSGYGRLSIFSTFSSGETPLLVKVDGLVKDTLTDSRPVSTERIFLKAGPHKISFVNVENQKTLNDTTIVAEATKTITLPRFWYTQGNILFDDYNPAIMPKPASGNILVRFISTAAELPEDMRIELVVYYRIGRSYFKAATGKTLGHVTKSGFSAYLELPDYKTLAPETALYYTLEGYDNATDVKVMGVGTERGCIILEGAYVPNMVYSLAIESIFNSSIIFSKSALVK